MRALVIHATRDLRIETRAVETPGRDEVAVRIARGGVCGSDLHYYQHGGFGTVRLREPMILGHEVSGVVTAVGAGVTGLSEGDLVAVSPSRPCKVCRFCTEGAFNHCLNMRFYGSAMPFPHIQGAFREHLVVDATQCVRANGLTPEMAALAEPLAVCLHATRRGGDMLGRRVLVTGCGPIGVMSILSARRSGAAEIVATDLTPSALEHAARAGADRVINIADSPASLQAYTGSKGYFDVLYECSGSEKALVGGIAALRPKGVILQLGLGGDMTLPMMQITAKEIDLRGSFRFHEEFETGVRLMQGGLIDAESMVTHTYPIEKAVDAFEMAGDRSRSMKVQIDFSAD